MIIDRGVTRLEIRGGHFMKNVQIFELADQLKECKEQKKELDAQTKELTAEIERLDLALSDAMAEAECDRFSHNGSTFYLKTRLYASPVSGKKDELMEALKSNGFDSIVTETVNANMLASFVKEQIALNDEKVPTWLSEVISTFEKTSLGIREG
jgi:gluconate kinase